MPIQLAHPVARRLARVPQGRDAHSCGRRQEPVTVEYDGRRPLRVDTVVVSTQHDPDVGLDVLTDAVRDVVVRQAVPDELLDDRTRYLVNPTGRFVIGADGTRPLRPQDHRRHLRRHARGGASAGRTRPSRSLRRLHGALRGQERGRCRLAQRFELQLAYAIGVARPLAVNVETFGTGRIPDERIAALISEHFDLRPGAIIEALACARHLRPTAAYGPLRPQRPGPPLGAHRSRPGAARRLGRARRRLRSPADRWRLRRDRVAGALGERRQA